MAILESDKLCSSASSALASSSSSPSSSWALSTSGKKAPWTGNKYGPHACHFVCCAAPRGGASPWGGPAATYGPHACHFVRCTVRAAARRSGSSFRPCLRRQARSRGRQPLWGAVALGRPGGDFTFQQGSLPFPLFHDKQPR